jgi:hypothetical protein
MPFHGRKVEKTKEPLVNCLVRPLPSSKLANVPCRQEKRATK